MSIMKKKYTKRVFKFKIPVGIVKQQVRKLILDAYGNEHLVEEFIDVQEYKEDSFVLDKEHGEWLMHTTEKGLIKELEKVHGPGILPVSTEDIVYERE